MMFAISSTMVWVFIILHAQNGYSPIILSLVGYIIKNPAIYLSKEVQEKWTSEITCELEKDKNHTGEKPH